MCIRDRYILTYCGQSRKMRVLTKISTDHEIAIFKTKMHFKLYYQKDLWMITVCNIIYRPIILHFMTSEIKKTCSYAFSSLPDPINQTVSLLNQSNLIRPNRVT